MGRLTVVLVYMAHACCRGCSVCVSGVFSVAGEYDNVVNVVYGSSVIMMTMTAIKIKMTKARAVSLTW